MRTLTAVLAIVALPFVLTPVAASDASFVVTKPPGPGPFPAVVIMHDCSGLGPGSSGAPWRWSSQLNRWGYVTLWPDSFQQRGHPAGVCSDPTLPRVPPSVRVDDAFAALEQLRGLPYVDGDRVAIMGGSHGGSTTLATVVDDPAIPPRVGQQFAAAVALYPACGTSYGAWQVRRDRPGGEPSFAGVFRTKAPLLILIGERDDWTPAEHCRRLADSAAAAGQPVRLVVYPGAHHSFDSPAPERYRAERLNRNAPSGRGATTGGDPAAWRSAIAEVRDFLQTHLAKR